MAYAGDALVPALGSICGYLGSHFASSRVNGVLEVDMAFILLMGVAQARLRRLSTGDPGC